MFWRKSSLLVLFMIFESCLLYAQSNLQKSAAVILMFKEPAITMGTNNKVFSEQVFGVKTFLFKATAAADWDTVAAPGDPNQFFEDIGGLQNGIEYQYRVLFGGDLSEIVFSKQDNEPPVVDLLLGGIYVNQNSFPIPFSTYDQISQSVKRANLYYRPIHNQNAPWRFVTEKALDSSRIAIQANPLTNNIVFIVPDSLGDGEYEFFVSVRDTAWAADHRPDSLFTGTEGNFFSPLNTTSPLKQIFIDTHEPTSSITSQLNGIRNSAVLSLEYFAKDSTFGHNGYLGSGIAQTALFMNYKTDILGPFVFQDSLYQIRSFATPLLAVNGAFNFVADKDGYYEFYTLSADTAQNRENNWLPKTSNLPSVFIDSSIPEIDSLAVIENGSEFPAKPGWTKEQLINYSAFGVDDILKDGYKSGLDSFFLAENFDFNQNVTSLPAQTGTISGNYNLSSSPGLKTIYSRVTDKAGNAGIPVSNTITYDPQPPEISNFEIPFLVTSARNISIAASFKDNFFIDSLFIWMNDSLISSTLLAETDSLDSQVAVTLPDQLGWHYLSAQIRDKAGNVSSVVTDSVKLSNVVVLNNLILDDLSAKSDPYSAADPGYSDSSVVSVSLSYISNILKLEISEDPSFTSVTDQLPPWNVVSISGEDTTIRFEYSFNPVDGSKNLYVRGVGPLPGDVSNIVEAGIIIDTVTPLFDKVSVYNVLSANDTTFGFTNARNVGVKTGSPDTGLSKLLFWENGQDSVLYQNYSPDTTYFLKSLDDSQIPFNAAIRDRAGNWSPVLQTVVVLDRVSPDLDSLYFKSVFSSTFQVSINVAAKDDTLPFGVGLLDQIIFSENQVFIDDETQSFNLPGAAVFSGIFEIDLTQNFGEHTVYSQVRDKAGNWSSKLSAKVEVVDIVQPKELLLGDTTPSDSVQNFAFAGWSNNDIVQVQLIYNGVLKRIIAAKDAAFSIGVDQFDNWTSVNDSTAKFDFDFGGSEGSVNLWIKMIGPNITDTSAVISGNIKIDKTLPELGKIVLFQVQSSGDTLFDYTNQSEVEIMFKAPSEKITHSLVSETNFAPVFFVIDSPSILYTIASPVNEIKTTFFSVRDSAGNWSGPNYSDSITLDTVIPVFNDFILSDQTSPGALDSSLTDEKTIEINFRSSDSDPGKLYRITIAQDENFTVNREVFLFNSQQIQNLNNIFTVYYQTQIEFYDGNKIKCWAAVEDSALNLSVLSFDEITFSAPLKIQSALFSKTDTSDSLFSDQSAVRLVVREISGVTEEIAFSENSADLNNWQELSTGELFLTDFTFSSAYDYFQGKLFVAARNSTGQFVLDSTSIIIDKTIPVISSAVVVATAPAGEQEYSNNRDVKIQLIVNDSGILSQVHISEDSSFSTFDNIDIFSLNSSTFQSEVDFELSATNGTKQIYIRALDAAENVSFIIFDEIIADYDPIVSLTNHPNPFNPNIESTILVVKTEGLKPLEVNIYDLFGNHVKKISIPAGERYNQVFWDGKNGKGEIVANGGYLCIVKTDSKILSRKIGVLK